MSKIKPNPPSPATPPGGHPPALQPPPRAKITPFLLTAPKGSTVHLSRCTPTTSVCPMISKGRFFPVPLMRATRLARAGSSANSWQGMPSRSRTP